MCEKRTGSLVLGHYVRAVCLLPLSLPLPLSMPHNGPPHKRAKSTSIEMHQLRTHTHTHRSSEAPRQWRVTIQNHITHHQSVWHGFMQKADQVGLIPGSSSHLHYQPLTQLHRQRHPLPSDDHSATRAEPFFCFLFFFPGKGTDH